MILIKVQSQYFLYLSKTEVCIQSNKYLAIEQILSTLRVHIVTKDYFAVQEFLRLVNPHQSCAHSGLAQACARTLESENGFEE